MSTSPAGDGGRACAQVAGPDVAMPQAQQDVTREVTAEVIQEVARDTRRGATHERPEAFQRVERELLRLGHPHAPRFLAVAARTAQEAAAALGVEVGQIAKSVVFRRRADDVAVLVVASGDRRVDEAKVARIVGAIGRADAAFVKATTGFTIGGVAPVAHATRVVTLIDRDLARFHTLWAAAGHPNGVFPLSPGELELLTGAPVHDVAQAAG